MSPPAKVGDPKDMAVGAVLQCVEAATLGMPFEVWKTRMGRYRSEGTVEAFKNVYKERGVGGFYNGLAPKLFESATKGAVLLFAKEGILAGCENAGMSPGLAGVVAGAGGGVAQVSVMGPCTFLVTAVVTGDKNTSFTRTTTQAYQKQGIKGLYPGGVALTFRQSTNWASRQGFTEFIRVKVAEYKHGPQKDIKHVKLTKWEEAGCGVAGGTLSCWNQPFEVARIQAQAAASAGEKSVPMPTVMKNIVKEHGIGGLYQGIAPRIGLGVWQTLFMVTGAKMIKEGLM